jgi:HTH-type transcriptional regulator/antitoxin HigA
MHDTTIDNLLKSIFSGDEDLDVRAEFDKKLKEYTISKTKALKLLKIDKDVFEQIISGTAKQPNLIHVIKLAEFLDIEIDKFVKVVLKNQNEENVTSIDNARKTTFLLKNFDVKTLTKLGFFESDFGTDELVNKVLDFFGYDSIKEYEEELEEPLYSRTKRNFSDKMKDFWVKSAYQTFRIIANPHDYDRNKLKDLIIKLKPYSQDVQEGLYTVCKALYHIGVTVIFQDYLSTTQIRGGTFIINGKPCVVITDYNKKYSTIWFTLLHELHHVLFDYDLIERNSFHLTGDDDLFLIEEKADSFARDYFLSIDKFNYIRNFINNPYLVSKFAKENEIHESLVYTFYTWYMDKLYGKNYHAAFREYYPKYKHAVAKLNPISWNVDSIKVASDRIRTILEIK